MAVAATSEPTRMRPMWSGSKPFRATQRSSIRACASSSSFCPSVVSLLADDGGSAGNGPGHAVVGGISLVECAFGPSLGRVAGYQPRQGTGHILQEIYSALGPAAAAAGRSEERRVGKEGRCG